MVDLANTIFRDFVVDGVPTSGLHQPRKMKIRSWGKWLEDYLAALNGGGELQGDWDASAGAFPGAGAATTGQSWIVSTAGTVDGVAFRIGDRVIAIADTASTATYSGNWIRLAAALEPVVHGADSGASTANAIAIATDYEISDDGGQLIAFVVPVTNTSGTVTVAFNGGSALSVKTAAGNDPAVGGLVAGMPLYGQITNSGAWFRLLSDQASAAIQAAAEAAQAAAEAAAASVAIVSVGNRTDLKALDTSATTTALFDGNIWKFIAGDYSTEITADTQEGVHIKADDTAASAGAWVRMIGPRNYYDVRWFGAVGDGATDDSAAFVAAIATGKSVFVPAPASYYKITERLVLAAADQVVFGEGMASEVRLELAAAAEVVPLFWCQGARSGVRSMRLNHQGADYADPADAATASGDPVPYGSCVILGGDDSFADRLLVENAWNCGIVGVKISDDGNYTITSGDPEGVRIVGCTTKGCGVGESLYVNGYEAVATKGGAGWNVGSASRAFVSDCLDIGSYQGGIVDLNAGAQCTVTNVQAWGTLQDAGGNGGIGFYFGAADLCVSNVYVQECAGIGIWLDKNSINGTYANLNVKAPGEEGLLIKSKDKTTIVGVTLNEVPAGYSALHIEHPGVDINGLSISGVTVDGATHDYAVLVTPGAYTIRAHIRGAVFAAGTAGYVSLASKVTCEYSRGDARIFVDGVTDFVFDQNMLFAWNLHYSGGFKYKGNGYGYLIKGGSNGQLEFQAAGNNASGADAAATLTKFFYYDRDDDKLYMPRPGLSAAALPTYADDSAAGSGGLEAGDFYKTSTGELRIKL